MSNKRDEQDFKWGQTILIVGITLVVFTPYLLSSTPWSIVDFSETGQIGDTIGGISAPICSLVGAILVFYSFKAQVIANKIQANAFKDEQKTSHYLAELNVTFEFMKEIKTNLLEVDVLSQKNKTKALLVDLGSIISIYNTKSNVDFKFYPYPKDTLIFQVLYLQSTITHCASTVDKYKLGEQSASNLKEVISFFDIIKNYQNNISVIMDRISPPAI